jgi:diadenosine tetraphosphatase ApaH/serine/threonine PP2A family protein phosphatase
MVKLAFDLRRLPGSGPELDRKEVELKLAVISDVHSNLESLLAVRAFLEEESPDEIFFLGDAVGYGPEPNECVGVLRDICPVILLGNHDAAVAGLIGTTYFNLYARQAVEFTAGILTGENRQFLASLPYVHLREEYRMVHATPCDPEEWNYLYGLHEAAENFSCFHEAVCFVGHSHSPMIISSDHEGHLRLEGRDGCLLDRNRRYIVNVGSVGQPRDGDPRAALAIYDTEEGRMEIVRIPYDVGTVQEKMVRKDLPRYLADRLGRGF